jgi:hypothetical protein
MSPRIRAGRDSRVARRRSRARLGNPIPPIPDDKVEQPRSTPCRLVTDADGFTIHAPTVPFERVEGGIGGCGVVLAVVGVLGMLISVVVALSFGFARAPLAAVLLLPFGSLAATGFWATAVGWGPSRFPTTLEVSRQTLTVTYGRGWGSKQRRWNREDLAAIRVVSDHGRPAGMCLEIVPVKGGSLWCLKGRDDDELAWIAAQLRLALDLPQSD